MTDDTRLQQLLRSEDGDCGCASADFFDVYIQLELSGEDPAQTYPATAIHLRTCPACRQDHDGLLEAARRFGHASPS